MSDIKELQKRIIKFRDAREWKRFDNPKDMALSLLLEAAEVLELFQWKNQKEANEYVKKGKKEISHELADVMYWVLIMSNDFGIDIRDAVLEKLEIQKKKYPLEKAKGRKDKYTAYIK